MGLAGQQWDEWSRDTWDKVLTDCSTFNTSAGRRNLCVQAANRLKLLNALEVSKDVVRHVCRLGGPIDRLLKREEPLDIELITIGEVLLHLAEVDTGAVADLLKRSLIEGEALPPFATWNRHLAPTLAKIAFKADTFEDGACLLFRLAAGNVSAKRHFVDLFNPIRGSTEADGVQRIKLLDSVSSADNTNQQEIVVEALAEGLHIDVATRIVGPEVHGTCLELISWYPKTKAEASAYVHGCAQRLINFAIRSDLVGSHARQVLGLRLDPLIRFRFRGVAFIEVVERAVDQVGQAVDDWPEAKKTLGYFLSELRNDELEMKKRPVQESPEVQALRKERTKWAQELLERLKPK